MHRPRRQGQSQQTEHRSRPLRAAAGLDRVADPHHYEAQEMRLRWAGADATGKMAAA